MLKILLILVQGVLLIKNHMGDIGSPSRATGTWYIVSEC